MKYFYFEQKLFQIGAKLFQIRAALIISNWSRCYFKSERLYFKTGQIYYKLGQVFQIRAVISNWGNYFKSVQNRGQQSFLENCSNPIENDTVKNMIEK